MTKERPRGRLRLVLELIPHLLLWFIGLPLLGFACVSVWISLPIHPYKAYCPGQELSIDGPFRERFVWLLSQTLSEFGISHVIYGNNIYPYGWWGNDLYHKLNAHFSDFQLNHDWKLAASISWGVKIDDVWFPPPERLLLSLKDNEAKYGSFAERDKEDRYSHSRYYVFKEDCEVFKAAVLPEATFAKDDSVKKP
jgi:hypothetical protein